MIDFHIKEISSEEHCVHRTAHGIVILLTLRILIRLVIAFHIPDMLSRKASVHWSQKLRLHNCPTAFSAAGIQCRIHQDSLAECLLRPEHTRYRLQAGVSKPYMAFGFHRLPIQCMQKILRILGICQIPQDDHTILKSLPSSCARKCFIQGNINIRAISRIRKKFCTDLVNKTVIQFFYCHNLWKIPPAVQDIRIFQQLIITPVFISLETHIAHQRLKAGKGNSIQLHKTVIQPLL